MYDILQLNILSKKVPLLPNALTNKKKSLYCRFIEKTNNYACYMGERGDVTNQKETML